MKVKNLLPLLGLTLNCQNVLAATKVRHDKKAKVVRHKSKYFRKGPDYSDHQYSAKDQIDIYGAKYKNESPWQPHIYGRKLYPKGDLGEGLTFLGKKNIVYPRFTGFGDLRTVAAVNEDAVDRKGELNTRLNLDLDFALTSTERIHAFSRPLDEDGEFAGFTFFDDESKGGTFRPDFKLDTLFFEGDLGSILSGITGTWSRLDLPFAFGLMPLIFHNGIWFNDAVTGYGFTIPATHSRFFNISNMDITFFHAYDEINSAVNPEVDDLKIYGFNAFIEANDGYYEVGYGYTDDESALNQDYSNFMFSFSHRWKNYASFSYRVIHAFGQELAPGQANFTADGTLFLFESSLITHLPYTFIPYLNIFVGLDTPQALANGNGLLNNVGIVFETDGVTNFQTLDNTGEDAWGGAVGLNYLFGLNQQIIVEMATVQVSGQNIAGRSAFDDEVGYGVRWQKPITKEFILRSDFIYAERKDIKDLYGFRAEFRWKF